MPNWLLFVLVVGAALLGLAINRWSVARPAQGEGFGLNDLVGPITTLAVVLLAFIMVEGLSSYGRAREQIAAEARIVDQMGESAARVEDADVNRRLQGSLVCYARAVIHHEWPAMANGDSSDKVRVWTNALEEAIGEVDPADPQAGRLIDQDNARAEARLSRLTEANPTIPGGLNLLMLVAVITAVVGVAAFMKQAGNRIVYLVVFAVFTFLMAGTLYMINDLDAPFRGLNKLEPQELERRAMLIEADFVEAFPREPTPCDEEGIAVS